MRKLLLSQAAVGVVALALLPAVPAHAQDVVMRRPIPKSQTVQGGASWRTTPWIIYDQSGNQVAAGEACGDYTERRTATCVNGEGSPVDEMFCRGVPKPEIERQARHDAGCTYSWDTAAWQDPGPSCSLAEAQTRVVTCRRDTDRVVMADSFCAGAKPEASRTVEDFATCTYTWTPGAFVDPGPSCTDAERQTRPVDCVRDLDKAKVGDALCTGAKPSTTQEVRDIGACTYSWKSGPFVDPGSSCTRSETQTREVTCHRSLNDELAPDASCAPGTKPSSTQVVEDYGSCSFKAVDWSEWTPSSTCSATATKTRTAKCQRSNDGGEIVDDALCQAAGVALSETVPEANYSTCTNSWDESGFIDPGASCGNETWSQSVTCRRDLDKALMPDASCTGAKPASTSVRYDVSGCGYEAVNWTSWSYASTCSASTSRTQTAQCRRGDGQIVDGSECTSRGVAVSKTETGVSNYSTCSNAWVQSGFVDPGASCGSETWTQSVTCRRTLDNALMSDSACSGAKPSTTDVRTDYSGCNYTAVNWTGWTPSSTCSATATKTRTAQCRRGDGTIVGSSECTSRGVAVSETVSEPNYSTCSSSWRESGFVDPGPSCGNETWTQSVTCRRDLDNALMSDASCPGAKPSTTSVRSDLSGCTYTPSSTQSSCVNGSQTVNYSCTRNQTGETVAQSFCGLPAQSTQSCSSYSWQTGGWGGWSACQAPGVQYQYRDVYCQQNNGGNLSRVDDSLCGGGRPANSNQQACTFYTYAWTYAGPSGWNNTCSTNAQRTQQYYCRREQDGASVAASNCAGGNPSYTESGEVYSGCTYTANYGGWGACQGGTQYRTNSCTRNQTGQSVAVSFCGINQTDSQGCTPPPAIIEGFAYFADLYLNIPRQAISGDFYREESGMGADNSVGYDGRQCGYQLTITYNGVTQTVTHDPMQGNMGHSGGCYTDIAYHNVGGRVFQVSASSSGLSSQGYGDLIGRITVR